MLVGFRLHFDTRIQNSEFREYFASEAFDSSASENWIEAGILLCKPTATTQIKHLRKCLNNIVLFYYIQNKCKSLVSTCLKSICISRRVFLNFGFKINLCSKSKCSASRMVESWRTPPYTIQLVVLCLLNIDIDALMTKFNESSLSHKIEPQTRWFFLLIFGMRSSIFDRYSTS